MSYVLAILAVLVLVITPLIIASFVTRKQMRRYFDRLSNDLVLRLESTPDASVVEGTLDSAHSIRITLGSASSNSNYLLDSLEFAASLATPRRLSMSTNHDDIANPARVPSTQSFHCTADDVEHARSLGAAALIALDEIAHVAWFGSFDAPGHHALYCTIDGSKLELHLKFPTNTLHRERELTASPRVIKNITAAFERFVDAIESGASSDRLLETVEDDGASVHGRWRSCALLMDSFPETDAARRVDALSNLPPLVELARASSTSTTHTDLMNLMRANERALDIVPRELLERVVSANPGRALARPESSHRVVAAALHRLDPNHETFDEPVVIDALSRRGLAHPLVLDGFLDLMSRGWRPDEQTLRVLLEEMTTFDLFGLTRWVNANTTTLDVSTLAGVLTRRGHVVFDDPSPHAPIDTSDPLRWVARDPTSLGLHPHRITKVMHIDHHAHEISLSRYPKPDSAWSELTIDAATTSRLPELTIFSRHPPRPGANIRIPGARHLDCHPEHIHAVMALPSRMLAELDALVTPGPHRDARTSLAHTFRLDVDPERSRIRLVVQLDVHSENALRYDEESAPHVERLVHDLLRTLRHTPTRSETNQTLLTWALAPSVDLATRIEFAETLVKRGVTTPHARELCRRWESLPDELALVCLLRGDRASLEIDHDAYRDALEARFDAILELSNEARRRAAFRTIPWHAFHALGPTAEERLDIAGAMLADPLAPEGIDLDQRITVTILDRIRRGRADASLYTKLIESGWSPGVEGHASVLLGVDAEVVDDVLTWLDTQDDPTEHTDLVNALTRFADGPRLASIVRRSSTRGRMTLSADPTSGALSPARAETGSLALTEHDEA